MTVSEIISGLRDLIRDRETFVTDEPGCVFARDKKVLEAAIDEIKRTNRVIDALVKDKDKLAGRLMRWDSVLKQAREAMNKFADYYVSKHIGVDVIKCEECGKLHFETSKFCLDCTAKHIRDALKAIDGLEVGE